MVKTAVCQRVLSARMSPVFLVTRIMTVSFCDGHTCRHVSFGRRIHVSWKMGNEEIPEILECVKQRGVPQP